MLDKPNQLTSGDENGPPPQLNEKAGEGGPVVLGLSGVWQTRSVSAVDAAMRQFERRSEPLAIDLKDVAAMDTAGAFLVQRLVAARERNGLSTEIVSASGGQGVLLDATREAAFQEAPARPTRSGNLIVNALASIGSRWFGFAREAKMAFHILGATIAGAQNKRGSGSGMSLTAIVAQIDAVGVGAVPVVLLMNTIIGAIIAQQGAFQLRYFGAEIFVVDLVSILVLREIGVLITAIMVAGRSGSAITAQIGSMKMREEVDALKVIGLNPIGVLVFPRVVALMIAMPCLTVAANAAGLAGAIATTWVYSGIAPSAFISRMGDAIVLSTFFSGLIKAPFMALIIGIVASMEGLKVGGSAESLGRRVTASVVKSIFCVIVLDGLFSIFYVAINY